MAGPAIDAGLVFAVAVETPAHLETGLTGQLRHLRDLAMAGAAIEVGPDMHHMGKVNMIGQLVDAHPGDDLLLFPISAQLLHAWVVHSDVLMTGEAEGQIRDPGHRANRNRAVTKATGYFIDTGM